MTMVATFRKDLRERVLDVGAANLHASASGATEAVVTVNANRFVASLARVVASVRHVLALLGRLQEGLPQKRTRREALLKVTQSFREKSCSPLPSAGKRPCARAKPCYRRRIQGRLQD